MTTPKDATRFTAAANAALLAELDWRNTKDFESAARGFIATLEDPVIRDAAGGVVWNLDAYAFLADESAPSSVNPSLWRQSRLNALFHGLFKVTEGVYQIRSYDLAVMSIIASDNGYVIVDPLTAPETARAGMELVYEHVGRKPIVAVIYTHTHVDHWGGIKDVILPGDMKDIMNQVLIAQKKAEANTIMRREETASTRSLLNTAKLMEDNAMLFKLKEMEYVEKIAEKVGDITISGNAGILNQLKELFSAGKGP